MVADMQGCVFNTYISPTPMCRGADIVVDMRGVAINNFFLLNILQVRAHK